MKRNNKRQTIPCDPYNLPILDDCMIIPKRRRCTQLEDMSDFCDPCGLDSFDPCGSNFCDPCCSNSCNPCGQDCCGSYGGGCSGSRSIGIDQKPTVKDCIWQVNIDVLHFNLEDITVYAENNKLIVEVKKKLDPCSLSNGFKREYEIPCGYDLDNVCVYLSSDCILIITIPCVKIREIEIQPIGPARIFIPCNTCTKPICECPCPCPCPSPCPKKQTNSKCKCKCECKCNSKQEDKKC